MRVFRKRINVAGIWILLAGLAAMGWGGYRTYLGWTSESWPTVEGRLRVSRLRRDVERRVPDVIYEYRVAGRTYRGARFAFRPPRVSFPADFERRYPEGGTVVVHYRPDRPERAVLEPGVAPAHFWTAVAGFLVAAVSAGVSVYEFRTGKRVKIG